MEHWAKAQESGYALIGNRAVPGVTAIGLPVINEKNRPIAAITVAAINSRMTHERVEEILPLLRQTTAAVAKTL